MLKENYKKMVMAENQIKLEVQIGRASCRERV